MMRSLYNGVSGLGNHQIRMDVISNNLANVNTVGFKKNVVNFRSVWYDTISGAPPMRDGMGGINPKQVGLGSAVASTTTVFTQGNTERTNRDLDMSISGGGFFVMKNGNEEMYSRAGAFVLDAEGFLSDPATGYKVQGWTADNGKVEAMGRLEDIQIPLALKKNARATTKTEYRCNLNEDHGPNFGENPATESAWTIEDVDGNQANVVFRYQKTGADTWSWTVTDLKDTTGTGVFSETTGVIEIDNDGNIVTSETSGGSATLTYTMPGGATPVTISLPVTGANVFDDPDNFTYNVSGNGAASPSHFTGTYIRDYHEVAGAVYDSLGTEHTMTIQYEKVADVNGLDTWTWKVADVTDIDPTGAGGLTSLDGFDGYQGNGTVQFDAHGRFANSTTANDILIDPNSNADRIAITPDFSNDTQYAGDSVEDYTNQQSDQNGYAMGVMTGLNIDEYGYIKVIYSNGQTDAHARIALKVFTNPAGLSKVGDTAFVETFNSGDGMIMAPWTNSAGRIQAGTLEMSNVDLAEEFTNMIVTQRGFQANTRVITTSDEMLTDLIGLKR